MEIREISSPEEWDDFINRAHPHTFLQSWSWGEFNLVSGYKIFRLGVFENETLSSAALIVKIAAKRGSFLFCPHGPIGNPAKVEKTLGSLVKHLKALALREKCNFVRFSPLMLKSKENETIFKSLGFRKAPTHMHSELVWILDIEKSEESLLKEMRKTTRYSINKAEKDGVSIRMSEDIQDVQLFDSIYQSTVGRQHFTPFSLKYLKNEFEIFAKGNQVKLFFAEYNKEIISAAMIIFTPAGAFYHHGASLLKYPKITASYLLQWEVIREAKRRGCSFYNFWGIAPENKKNHPWKGLSLFKKGFGGFEEEYLPAMDLVLSPKYWFTYFIEKLRKVYRRL